MNTGTKYEHRMQTLLEERNVSFQAQKVIGKKRNGGNHRVDLILDDGILVSLKHQEVAGTAEEKVPFEFMKLQHAVDDYNYNRAYIVLSGDTGWTWKDYYLSDEFQAQMSILYPDVTIMSHEVFCDYYLN